MQLEWESVRHARKEKGALATDLAVAELSPEPCKAIESVWAAIMDICVDSTQAGNVHEGEAITGTHTHCAGTITCLVLCLCRGSSLGLAASTLSIGLRSCCCVSITAATVDCMH